MKRLGIAIVMSLLAAAAAGQTNVYICGTSAGAVGKTVGLYCYSDMLTCGEVLLDEARIDTGGAFRLGCYVNYPRLVFIQVERYSQAFYVEAGRRYEVYIPEFDWDVDERQNVYLSPVALPLEFIGVADDELNLRISRFDDAVDSFVSANRVWFDARFHPQRRWFDTLVAELRRRGVRVESGERGVGSGERREESGGDFVDSYVDYSLAGMRLALGFESRGRLAARYIEDRPIRYWDEAYMRFFFSLYADAISLGTRRVPQSRLVEWVERGDLDRYMDSVGLDPLLRNGQVRELAVLEALKESYYDRSYSSGKVREMVARLGRQTRFSEHRELADRVLAMFDRGASGSDVPEFSLPDVDHRTVSLDDMRGKWVYLSFVRVGDPNSLAEIETMAHFRDSVYARNPDVVFVSVCCDREFEKMYHFLRTGRRGQRYNWTWLHFDGNYRLLERYGVVSYPTFLLINPEGRLHYTVTPPPASGILLHGPWERRAADEDVDQRPFYMR